MIAYFLALLGSVCTIFCFYNRITFDSPIWMMPLVYSFGMIMNVKMSKILLASPGLMMFNILMFFRYALTPCAYYSKGYINLMIGNNSYLYEGTLLIIYEEIVAFITLFLTERRYEKKYRLYQQKVNKTYSFLEMKTGSLFLLFVVLVLLYIGATYKSLGMGLTIFMSGNLSNMEDIEYTLVSGLGYVSIIWQSLLIWLYVYIIMSFKRQYERTHSIGPFIQTLLVTFVLILLTFIDSTGITRWYTVVTASAALFTITQLFPKYKKSTIASVSLPVLMLIVFSSLIKNSGYDVGAGNISDSANEMLDATNMDVYFNGVGNVKATFKVEETSNVGLTSIIPDILKCMPVVSHYIPMDNATSNIFHKAVGRDDQIVPMIGQGYVYFGAIFSPLLTIISILLFRYFDLKFRLDNSYTKYGYAFAAVWLGVVAMCLNITITFMWIYIRVVPFIFVLWLTNRYAQQYRLKTRYK